MRRIRAHHVLLAWLIIYFPWLPGYPLRQWLPSVPNAWVLDANLAGEYALIAFSLVILTGWVGQISLGQGAFVGIGAFATGVLVRRLGIVFPLNLPIVALLAAGTAALLGLVALRVRGLYLAVATLIFAWMADAYLFSQSWLVGGGGASSVPNHVIGNPGTYTAFDFTNKRTFYLVVLATVAAAWYAAVNLRHSKTGRAFFAVRGSEMAAASLGINVIRYKLLAFALSGALAGIAGNLIMTDVRAATPVVFQFTVSLFYLSIAVVGGITSLGGAVAASVLFSGLNEAFYRLSFLNGWLDLVTVGLLLTVLLGYPGGLGALGAAIARQAPGWHRRWSERLAPVRRRVVEHFRSTARDEEPADTGVNLETEITDEAGASAQEPERRRFGRRVVVRRSIDLGAVAFDDVLALDEMALVQERRLRHRDWRTAEVRAPRLPRRRKDRVPVLEARDVVVQFGGLRAVDHMSLQVCEHEIVGLIGPNGAGKTTMFNAVAGLNEPTAGAVLIFGEDATRYPVHLRAQMGVGRTFQLIQLFPQLTVFDNLLVATHVHNPTGVFSHLALTGRAIDAERDARARVRVVIELLGLEDVADRMVTGLPFGVLRQVEIARALVTESPVLMLDEPASGLDNAETDELARLLGFLRGELGVSILLIEHDVRLVTRICDYIYVLNRGALLAEGTPAEIQRHPDVVAAYLGAPEVVAG